ncbi:MAG: hypothetical protein A2600_06815 [Candidatus Lambdaproteobacteria bacterium RIFOXYD1_FULL_56_27]|uniref:Single-stranded DNA-binding protein n=1 Tax=Candidatus Lambdaproteobacteria bacterium RIFOXYD2_FULL_56_26 TaxID=1817773 RepID=A0A1F6GQ07_9PROT|nr:MAG: hypothetical protein A2557_05475 [Candidatus Lambdaproteobacteria bacterium RIFOXYD2_FULL_56_26]OGH03645.1 MAG: hypothetical protein A2426_00265 [Candidatus Lambdaproteobacteria bacterium RIFOXYC1_FULL_56_13]OGH07229.1 MAG: hypothetical protein A2600_06815 [Candidatus Lambdaproteobacteria bacterium RIFOXYD1_FULL_56_27]
MGNLNKVLLIGRLGQDPEKRVTPTGHSVVTLNIATSERFNDKGGNKQERTEWHRVVFWDKSADLIEQYLKKGSQLYVEGALQTREWQDKDGNKRYSTEIVARNFQFLDSPQQRGSGQGSGQAYGGAPQGGYGGQPQNTQKPAAQGYGAPQGGGSAQNNNSPDYGPPPSYQGDDFIEDDIPF